MYHFSRDVQTGLPGPSVGARVCARRPLPMHRVAY